MKRNSCRLVFHVPSSAVIRLDMSKTVEVSEYRKATLALYSTGLAVSRVSIAFRVVRDRNGHASFCRT